MSRRANVVRHGANHSPKGSDPIPGLGPIDSTENVGDTWGVHSEDPGTGHEPENYVLTADGLGGSIWAPSSGVPPTFEPFYDAITTLAATRTVNGYWRLGESASPFADTSGKSGGPRNAVLNATGNAATLDVAGALPAADDDGAVEFNGHGTTAGDYLRAADTSPTRVFNFNTGPMSVAAWVKPKADATSFQAPIASAWGDAGFGNCGWGLFVEWPARQPAFRRRQSGTPASESYILGPALTVGEWAFLVATYDSTNGHCLYVNGELVALDPQTFNGLPGFNDGVFFGKNTDTTAGYGAGYLPGSIDEVSVWASALTADEVATLAGAGGLIGATTPGLIAVGGNYSLTSSDDVVLATGTITITLPDAIDSFAKQYTVKNIGTDTVTIARTSSQKIDGVAADQTLAAADSLTVVSDGSNWQIVSRIRALVDGGSP